MSGNLVPKSPKRNGSCPRADARRRRNSEDELEQGRISQQLVLLAPSGIIESTPASSLELDLLRFRVHWVNAEEQENQVKQRIENYTTIGLRISRYGAAEVYNDFAEQLRHTETNPMCSIHQSRIAPRRHSRHQIVAWSNLRK